MTLAVARILPWVLRRLRDEHDLFLIASVGSGLALAGLGAAVFGVPLALAAFVGGLAVTESHEADEARRRLRPFRDVFAVLFFVAIGTLVDPSQLGAAAPWIVLLLGLVRGRQGRRRVGARPGRATRGTAAPARRRSRSDRGVLLRAGHRGPRRGHDRPVLFTAIIAAVAVSIAASSIAVRLRRRPHGVAGRAAGYPRARALAPARAAERGRSMAGTSPGSASSLGGGMS